MASPAKPVVCIVTPGTRDANNGNWRTAARWAEMLRDRCQVIVQTDWDAPNADALIALHAMRSAGAVERYREARPRSRIAVVLTGTDLYRDLPASLEARSSLETADQIVVLQAAALQLLEEAWRAKARVIHQSARPLAARRKARTPLACVAVGHLRAEKDPQTLFDAVAQLPPGLPVTIRHIGAPLDPDLGERAQALARAEPRYRYAGALPHGLTRAAIASASLLVHPSRMEGGANVIVEAVMSHTPVLASRIPGNLGMLGEGYPGYFAVRDPADLAARLAQALEPGFYRALAEACEARRGLFEPRTEARAVRDLVARLVA